MPEEFLAATLAGRSGVSESENPWALVGLTTVVAGACTVVAGYWKLRPAGSLFHIFAFAAVASVPYQPPLGEAMLTAVGTVVFIIDVFLLILLYSSMRRLFPRHPALCVFATLAGVLGFDAVADPPEPLPRAFAVSREAKSEPLEAALRRLAPIGCRDAMTLEYLQQHWLAIGVIVVAAGRGRGAR